MSGSWHLYRIGESWQRAAPRDAGAGRGAGLGGGVLQRSGRRDVPPARRQPPPGLGGLGPDLVPRRRRPRRCVELLLAYDDPQATLAEVLLDQRVFCGVGNVYRCEVLWAGELSPFAHVGDLPEADAVRLVNVAAKLVRANLHHAERITVPGVPGGLAVYGRSGQRCQRCGGTIESRRSGEPARTLYWCPGCQVRLDPRRSRPTTPSGWTRPRGPPPGGHAIPRRPPWRRTG